MEVCKSKNSGSHLYKHDHFTHFLLVFLHISSITNCTNSGGSSQTIFSRDYIKIKAHYIATATMFLHIFMCVHTCIHTCTDIDQILFTVVLSIRFLYYEASGTRGYRPSLSVNLLYKPYHTYIIIIVII